MIEPKAISVRRIKAHLKFPFSNAQKTWPRREGLLLQITTAEGRIGQGEASPLPGYSPDSTDSCERALNALGKAALAPLHPHIPLVALAQRLDEAELGATPAARCAVEMALLDLCGQYRRQPLYQCLLGPLQTRRTEAIKLALIIPTEPEQALQQARLALSKGYSTVKLKIGVNWERELATVQELRRHFGDELRLRVDVNQSWSPPEALPRLELLRRYNIEFVEEPTATEHLKALEGLGCPLALDESVRRLPPSELTATFVKQYAVRALVLKPMVLGGATACRRWLDQVETLPTPKPAIIFSHLVDGPIARTFAGHLALAWGTPSAAAGLGPHVGLTLWESIPCPIFEGAQLVQTLEPGLGIEPLAPPNTAMNARD